MCGGLFLKVCNNRGVFALWLSSHSFSGLWRFQQRRHDSSKSSNTEKAVAAGVAPVSRKTKPALYRDPGSSLDSFARDVLQVEIAAARTVGVTLEASRHPPGIKTPVAGVAAPRSQPDDTVQEIESSPAVRSETVNASTLRANHLAWRLVTSGQRRIPKTPAIGKQAARRHASLKSRCGPLRARLVTSLSSTMDIALALSHNSALMTRLSARPRRIDEFDPEYAR